MATYKSIAYDQILANASAMVLLKTIEASSSATITFSSGIDSTYKEYFFSIIGSHPSTNPGIISFQATTDGTNYNTTVTSSYFRSYHNEADDSAALAYAVNFDQAQGTAVQNLDSGSGNANDKASSGYLHLYNPADTTFVKHFTSTVMDTNDGDFNHNVFTGGYFNTTSAITGIRFQLDSGNIDAGTFKLYGVN
jgi:hypothetical protein